MGKKTVVPSSGLEWDPNLKEPWFIDFEMEPVNDEKWSCIVTAAIQSEAQAEECIQIFTQCASTGLRKAIKVITMENVIKLLKETGGKTESKKKDEKPAKGEKRSKSEKSAKEENEGLKPPPPRVSEIPVLAAKYATFTDIECKLPPDLMAAVLKYLILNLKDEHYFWKRVEWMKARKKREEEIRAKFIRDLKPYEMATEEQKDDKKKGPPNILGLQEPIDDEPFAGPDLYIMLTDFYDPFCFPELVRINVPFIALLRISCPREPVHHLSGKTETTDKKGEVVAEFWRKLMDNCIVLEKTTQFKDIAMMQYHAPLSKNVETKQNTYSVIYDQLSWMQYSAYCIYRQHQKYLQQLYVQRLILSLEPLDLSSCEVYNKLCDALITGEPITPCLILYAMVEQVVVGVPPTENIPLEFEPRASSFFSFESESQVFPSKSSSNDLMEFKAFEVVIPCDQCRTKKVQQNICDHWKKSSNEDYSSERNESTITITTATEMIVGEASPKEEALPESKSLDKPKTCESHYEEIALSGSFIDQVVSERKSEKQGRKWKSPRLMLCGDSVTLQTYHCDSRILDPAKIIARFLKNSDFSRLWSKYPELSPEERAFYNYHFFSLWKISEEDEESLKLKVLFTLSMKLIGITKSYLYKGEDENLSEMFPENPREKPKKLSKVKFDKYAVIANSIGGEPNFSTYFFKTFIVEMYLRMPRKTVINMGPMQGLRGSIYQTDSWNLRKVASQFSIYPTLHQSSGTCAPYCFKLFGNSNSPTGSQTDKLFTTLLSLLDCFEISNLTEPNFLNDRDEYVNLIQNFNFFEELEPDLMVQRLLEAQENYNTIQCSYFPPTDTLLIIMQNDFDYRGIFFTYCFAALPTPVTFRDFYNYVYPEISDWLLDEDAEDMKFTTELQEKTKEMREKCEAKYLTELKRYYCQLNEEEKKGFMEKKPTNDLQLDEDLDDLPKKPKLRFPSKVSFVTTNFLDVRVEVRRIVHEYHSRDGTEVNVVKNSWLYEPLTVISLCVKRSGLGLYYHHLLGNEEINTTFTFKTSSDITFVFYKNEPEDSESFNYHVKISWPVGLLIEGIPQKNSQLYIKQGYLKVYRKGWDIEKEKYRCYLGNGQILIFNENGDVNILTASGTKYSLFEFEKPEVSNGQTSQILFSRYEITTSIGEVWGKITKGPCRNKKKLINTHKIYIGVDPKTQETFYRRDDGVQFMLWPSGKLITKYLDGTKITSTPDFDEAEIFTEWTPEEKSSFERAEDAPLQPEQQKSRTILRKHSSGKTTFDRGFFNEGFVSVSCSYLMEHPKYASVSFSSRDPYVEIKMPHQLSIKMHQEGSYQIKQDRYTLEVKGTTAEFSSDCSDCSERSVATLSFDSGRQIMFKLVDFFQKVFSVHRNGGTTLQDAAHESNLEEPPDTKDPNNSCGFQNRCDHTRYVAEKQRCFAFERDLSGMEFLHSEFLASQCHHLPDDTFYELNCTCKDSILSHTFSRPYYKVGYETWVMEYEDKNNSLPINLRKKDLREMGVKDNRDKLYKYPFPKNHDQKDSLKNDKPKQTVEIPKVIETRTIKSFAKLPNVIIEELQKQVGAYQKRAHDIYKAYKKHKQVDDRSQDSNHIKMRLRKIALTLNQSLDMYPHLCSQTPSTEKDIHYFGHFINTMDTLNIQDDSDLLPDCKQIPRPLPRSSDFPSILEENDSPRHS